MWKILSLLLLLVGLLLWDIRYHYHNTKIGDNSIKKPSLSSIEKAIAKNGLQKGSPAPDFVLENMSGEKMKLSDYKGKEVIINFWATWCPPCKTEMPVIESFYQKSKDKNVVVLAVNQTNLEKNKKAVQQFIQDHHLTFPVLLDLQGKTSNLYQSITIPTTFMIDASGNIAKKIVGPMEKGQLEALLS